jgi:ABC-type antimicrobial peptide transport system permease subunit
MQLVEVAANIYTHLPDTFELVNALIAHTLFFGIPIAYIARWRLAPRT